MASTKQMSGFTKRFQFLIDRYFDGNVTRAARELKVRQRALQKIYAGVTNDPRLSTILPILQRIPQLDIRWFLLGETTIGTSRSSRAIEFKRVQDLMASLIVEYESPGLPFKGKGKQ